MVNIVIPIDTAFSVSNDASNGTTIKIDTNRLNFRVDSETWEISKPSLPDRFSPNSVSGSNVEAKCIPQSEVDALVAQAAKSGYDDAMSTRCTDDCDGHYYAAGLSFNQNDIDDAVSDALSGVKSQVQTLLSLAQGFRLVRSGAINNNAYSINQCAAVLYRVLEYIEDAEDETKGK